MVKIVGVQEEVQVKSGQTFADILKAYLSNKKRKQVVACKCDGQVFDLFRQVPEDCREIEPVYIDTSEGLDILRHSAAHILSLIHI